MAQNIAILVVLILASFVLVLFELLTPTFGVISVIAVLAMAFSVWWAWTMAGALAVALMVGYAIAMPAYIILLARLLPKSPFGRKLFLKKVELPRGTGTPDAVRLDSFIGKTGVAETLLRPAGAVRIDGHRIQATAQSGIIEKGSAVKVIAADGTAVTVRLVSEPGHDNPPSRGA